MRKQSSVALLLVGLIVLVIGCSDTPDNSATETPTVESAPAQEAAENVVAKPTEKPEEPAEAAKSPIATPEKKDTKAPTPAKPTVAAAEEPPAKETPAPVAAPKVKFPEMKMSDHAAKIRALFIEAEKQLKEERYVGAIQTLRKVDEMELSEVEEKALDMFLQRVSKAMNGGDAAKEADADK